MPPALPIRSATVADAPAIAAIYAHHVLHGTATFETEPPTAAEFAGRISKMLDAGWPWLVASDGHGEVLGYAYASQFRDRPAYSYTCENSIYIKADCRGLGVGKALLVALLDAAAKSGFRQMIAVIAGGEAASVALHASCGLVETGRMRSSGRKHGRWLDTLYMQIALGEGDETPPDKEPG